jgi:phage tail sheath gpL-like
MGLPLAVSPTVLGPGLYITVDLLAAVATPGSQPLKAVIMSPRSTAGNLTVDTEIRRAGSMDDGSTAFGIGSPGHLALQRFLEKNPNAVVDMIAPTASAGVSATGTITFTGGPVTGAAYNVLITICGRQINVPWNVGEVLADIQARAVAFINQQSKNLPVTASAGGAGVVTLTFKVPGPWGNDVLFSAVLQNGTGGNVAVSNSGQFTGGTTEPDFTTALNTISGTQYDFILLCVSNADADSSSATSNPGRAKTKVNSLNTGLLAKLQRVYLGATGALSAAKTGAIGRNDPVFEFPMCINGQGLPCELGATEMGDAMASVAIDPAANRIGNTLENFFGSANLVADTPTGANIEDALGNGVSIVSYNAQGTPIIVRPISTHSQDSGGNPDRRAFDMSGTHGMYAVGNDIKVALPTRFPKAKLSKNLAADADPLPAGVVEERDILAFLVERLRFWQAKGVVRKDLLDLAIANGTIIVQVDGTDSTQVDIVIPLGIFPPLAKFGVYMQKVA